MTRVKWFVAVLQSVVLVGGLTLLVSGCGDSGATGGTTPEVIKSQDQASADYHQLQPQLKAEKAKQKKK